ncbi:hypothetical protein [Anaerosporobacter sp.]
MKKILSTILCLCLVMTLCSHVVYANDKKDNQSITVLKKPPMKYMLSKGAKTKKVSPLKLTQKSKKSNEIIDEEKWFTKNKLNSRRYQIIDRDISYYEDSDYKDDIPSYVEENYDYLILTDAFYDDNYVYCTYGGNYAEGYILTIYNKKTKEIAYQYDFSNYRYSSKYVKEDYDYIQQKIMWATIKNNVLYVSNSHLTYAKSSYNQNAYITAIDLKTNKLIWRSQALVANSYRFEIIGDVIITGYGFTDKPDYIYQLNIHTGKIISKLLVKTAPEYIVKKGNYLYIRTYNTDYVYKISK